MFDRKLRESGIHQNAFFQELKDSSGACGKDTQRIALSRLDVIHISLIPHSHPYKY